MNMFLVDNEVILRLGFFVGIFALMALWETFSPRRSLTQGKSSRWANNLFLTFFNAFLVRLLLPVAAVGTALVGAERKWGLFHALDLPPWLAGLLALVLFDLAIYTQHVIFHKVHPFWRLHRMHHTDLDIDVTTGARFHPLEILLSMLIKMGVVLLLGAPVWSVIVFEILLNGTSMFNHSNIFIPERADGLVRLFVVTPDMHRVHHSVIRKETDSNFGFNFPWWDRIFRTYRPQPAAGHTAMTIGLANYRESKWLKFHWMLSVPFSRYER